MPNQYKNKVIYGDSVLMDITDTTAEAGDVASGAVFYAKNGARTVGTFTQVQSDWNETDSTDPSYILNKPTIDTAMSSTSTNPVTNSAITTAIANNRGKVFYGVVDNTSTATAFTAQIPGITAYEEGLVVILKNGVVTSASGFTININGLGALPAYNNLGAESRETTIFNVAYTMMFVYENRVSGGDWLCYRGSDANTNTIGYQLRTNSMSLPMKSVTYRYRLLFTSADGAHFVPANNTTSTNATASRAVCQDKIDPFGPIYYYSTTASVAANSRPSAVNLWEQYTIALGYSFNRTDAALTLTPWAPVYVKCAPQADGSAIIDSTTPYVQVLPTTADGKIYIFLGVAYSATNIELLPYHPVYCYRNGEIQIWTGTQGAFIPNFTPSDNGKILSIDNNGDVVATVAPSIPSASSSTPLVDGTASAGSSTAYARGDHVHPVSSIAALSDTNISSPSVGQALVYNSTSSKWVNASVSASDIGAIPAPQAVNDGQFLKYKQLSQDVYGWGVTDLYAELNNTSAIFYELEPTNDGRFIVEETFANIYQIFSSTRKTYFIAIDYSTGDVCIFTIVGVNSYTQTILLLSASGIHEENFLRLTLYADNEHNLMYGSISTITIPNLYDTTLQILSDTTISNPSSGQVLTYDDTSSKWVNSTLTLPSASSSAPLADGTAAVGTSTAYARADHVHPKINQPIDSTLSTTSENPVQNKVIKSALDDLEEEVKPKWTYLPHRTNPAIDAHNSYSMANATKLGTASTLRHNLMLEANWNTGYFIATWTESTGNKDYADSSGQTSVYAVCYRDVWNQRPEKTDADIAISSTVDVFPHNETVLDVSGNSLCTIVAASDSTVRKLSSGYIFIGTIYGSDGKYHIVYRTADTSTTPSITLGSTINVLKINGAEWDMTTLRNDYTQKTSQLNTYIILRNNVYYMAVVQNGVGVAIMKSSDCMDWQLQAHIPDPDAYLEACVCALPWISNNMPTAYVAVRHNYGDGYITLFGFDGLSFTKQMEKVYIPASTGRPMMFSDANVNLAYLCFSVNGRRNAVLVRIGSNNDGTAAYEILTTPFNVMSNYPCAVSNNKIILFGGTNALTSAKSGVSICPLWSEELRNYNAQAENLIDVVEQGAFIPNFTPSDNGKILSIDNNGDVVATVAPSIPSASSSAPLVDGASAVVGTSTAYARADHVHPKITQTISMSNNVITLTGSDGSTSSVTLPVYDGTVTSGGGS